MNYFIVRESLTKSTLYCRFGVDVKMPHLIVEYACCDLVHAKAKLQELTRRYTSVNYHLIQVPDAVYTSDTQYIQNGLPFLPA